jgi:murein DD-endopeptidase MepM/ murein hydrolase activator NlpD
MTAFARGLNVGSRVRQGQVIGFVGSTGLSTGAHVHFEILINDRFVNLMTVKLPRGRVLEGNSLAMFEKSREQLDSVLTQRLTGRAGADNLAQISPTTRRSSRPIQPSFMIALRCFGIACRGHDLRRRRR